MRIELGEIQATATGWRRWLLFNSRSQFLSWACCVALVCAAGALLIWWHNGAGALAELPLVGALAGSLPSVWLARPSHMRVRGPGRAQAFSVLEDRMLARGFAYAGLDAGVHRYRRKGPRWMRWKEQDVKMAMGGDALLVSGPYVMLNVHRRLLRSLFDA
nr:hypothetical protein [uncultured Massilia sp.]